MLLESILTTMTKTTTLFGFSLAAINVGAFVPVSNHRCRLSASPPSSSPHRQNIAPLSARNANDVDVEEWTSLTDDSGVKMRVISSPVSSSSSAAQEFPFPEPGNDVTVEYVGSIAPRAWSVDDVNACWLPEQGLSSLAPELFEAFDIDGEKLMNPKKFSKKFIFEGLGVLKQAKIDTLSQAAQDLARSEKDHPAGTVFDKNRFTFRLGKGMSIEAFDLAVREMRVGETVSVVARCDYAYGVRGLRSAGKFLVPAYGTVQYDLTLVEIK